MQELDSLTLRRAKKGDRQAFKTLYDMYAPFLWRVLFPMAGRDMGVARELLQDTFVKVHDSLRQFGEESALSTWLYRIAYTTAMARYRKEQRHRFVELDEQFMSSERADEFDDRQLVERIFTGMSAEDRFLIVAREVHDISFDDLASVTGQTSGALRTRLHRLKAAVRAEFPQEQFVGAEV
jgi:RNA polymerase sigma factor (sigma-70 family)